MIFFIIFRERYTKAHLDDNQFMELINFQSNCFWNEPDKRQSQKLYVALCLFISAASDFAVGLDLNNSGKLNWSTTASYYSILHSARLIIFLAIGDYPAKKGGHTYISNFFAGKPKSDKSPDKSYFGDWLEDFTHQQIRRNTNDKFTLESICNYYAYSLKLPNTDILFSSIGKILNNAKDLRNNSNYDALLMAHEWHHVQITDDFTNLSKSMSDGAKLCLEIASSCLVNYIIYEPVIESNRDKIKYLAKNYIVQRLYPAIDERIQDKSIIYVLKESTKKIENLQVNIKNCQNIVNELNEFENSFSMDRFSHKKSLMDRFKSNVENLRENVRSAINNVKSCSTL